MKLKKVGERIKSLELEDSNKYSSFYFVSFDGDDLEDEPTEVLPLENNMDSLSFEGKFSFLTDKEGNILKVFTKKEATILAVEKDNIIIKEKYNITNRLMATKSTNNITHYRYDRRRKTLEEQEVLYSQKEGTLLKAKLVGEKDTILLDKNCNGKTKAVLYSINKGYITPEFTKLEEVPNTEGKIFRYTDEVESNESYQNEKIKSNIIGYIDSNGLFGDEIYDEYKNTTRKIDLNSHLLFMQYYSLKRFIAQELDDAIDKKIDRMHSKNQQLKVLEYKMINKQ